MAVLGAPGEERGGRGFDGELPEGGGSEGSGEVVFGGEEGGGEADGEGGGVVREEGGEEGGEELVEGVAGEAGEGEGGEEEGEGVDGESHFGSCFCLAVAWAGFGGCPGGVTVGLCLAVGGGEGWRLPVGRDG